MNQLFELVHYAQKDFDDRGRDIDRVSILLNNRTYHRLRHQLIYEGGLFAAGSTINIFTYYGVTISWSPALDEYPEGNIIGEIFYGS